MKVLLLSVAVLALMAQTARPREAYPGQADHKPPPKNWNCTHDERAPKAHQCECKRMCHKDEEGNTTVPPDPKCKTYCFESHCHCEIACGGKHT